MIINKVI